MWKKKHNTQFSVVHGKLEKNITHNNLLKQNLLDDAVVVDTYKGSHKHPPFLCILILIDIYISRSKTF